MKKLWWVLAVGMVCALATGGTVGLPEERVALPPVQGDFLVCVWDQAAGDWLQGFEDYDHSGSYRFQVPAWGQWYWVGLWDNNAGQYVFGKWIGHFKM